MKISTPLIKPITILEFIAANIGISFIILVVFFKGAFENLETFLLGMVWSFAICSTQWLGPIIINYLLDKKYRWIDQPVKRTFIEIFCLLLWSITAFVAVQTIMHYLVNGLSPQQSWDSIAGSIIITFLISFFISLTFTAIGFFRAWQKSAISEAEMKTQVMAYKYESLRNQLNPHFLFNSLNVLSDLVYTDQAQAVKFIRQMSDLFHYVLDSRDKELVPLQEELEFMNAYAYLMKTRFGDKLRLTVNLDENTEAYIVPMTLQLLIENAVKHNEVSEKYPLEIIINRVGDYLEVENARKPKQVGEMSGNTGLKNISQQYSYFTDQKIEVIATENTFRVRVPLINSPEK